MKGDLFMAIHFNKERMEQVKDAHARWWQGTLDRPLQRITLMDAHPAEKRTPAPVLSQASCADLRWSPEQIIDALDEQLSQYEYLGDAFPIVNFDAFGPGVLAAFCGARLDNSSGNVWFFPREEKEIGDIHVRYDPQNPWAQRIKGIYQAGIQHWQGNVIMTMPDLGGVMDVAAVFRGSENLLMDLYDEPEEVYRLNQEIQAAWYEAYEDLARVLQPQNAYSDWSGLVSREPSYIIQSDFSYMISNEMFRDFVLPCLQRDTERLHNTIYHLDGVGELKHLEDLLALPSLNAIQWIYGDGQPSAPHWMDVYRKIQQAGKQMMIVGSAQDYLQVLEQIHGTPYVLLNMSTRDKGLASCVLDAR